MFPAPFDYSAPTTLEEACATLAERGDDAKVMAGGQSLIPLLKLRLAAPAIIVDIGHVSGLDGVEVGGDVRIGAHVRHVDVEQDQALRRVLPIMADAARQISDPLVRNRGTVCGSVCHADPQGDWGSVMLALDARVVARSAAGTREIAVRELFDGPFTTRLRPDEVVTEIRIPRPASASGGAYLKLERK
ncbi:MAG TPA: FAD binding domain-containing protein, partial [Candidatus Dormibacteraeota bacterium]